MGNVRHGLHDKHRGLSGSELIRVSRTEMASFVLNAAVEKVFPIYSSDPSSFFGVIVSLLF